MTTRFWYHFSISAALAVGVTLFAWFAGSTLPLVDHTELPAPGLSRLAVLGAIVVFLYTLARLLLRVTGSDRTMGLLGLYSVALYLPFVAGVAASAKLPVALLLVAGAILEVLDVSVAPANAVRSGMYMSVALVLDPTLGFVAGALVPVVAVLGWPRWRLPALFTLAAVVPWLALSAIVGGGGWAAAATTYRSAFALADSHDMLPALRSRAGGAIRTSWENGFQWTYAAFCAVGLLAATVRRLGPSRRGIGTVAWLLAVVVAAGTLSQGRPAPLFEPLGYLLLVFLANAGLAALAALNPLHAGRRRMIPVNVLFLLPVIIGWIGLVV